MKVKELIEQLQKFDGDKKVALCADDSSFCVYIKSVKEAELEIDLEDIDGTEVEELKNKGHVYKEDEPDEHGNEGEAVWCRKCIVLSYK